MTVKRQEIALIILGALARKAILEHLSVFLYSNGIGN